MMAYFYVTFRKQQRTLQETLLRGKVEPLW